MTKTKKILFLSLIIVLFIAVIVGVFYYFQKEEIEEIEKIEEREYIQGIDLSKNILNWISGKRDLNGTYIVGEKCTNNDCSYISSHRSGFIPMWARYHYYKVTQNEPDLDILKYDLDIYSNKNIVELIQNNSLNCYFMADLYEDEIFNEEYKNKIEKICLDSEYEINYALFTELGKPEKLEDLKIKLDISSQKIINSNFSFGKSVIINDNIDLNEDPKDFDQFLFAAPDRMARYKMNNNEDDLKSAIIDFSQGLNKYKENNNIKPYEGCYLGIGSLEYYKLTNNDTYKQLSELIANQQFERIDKNSERDISICGLFFEKLFKETENSNYLNYKNSLIDHHIKNNLSQDKKYFYTDFNGSIIKRMDYNGILSKLLINY